MKKSIFFGVFLILLTCTSFAQRDANFYPFPDMDTVDYKLLKEIVVDDPAKISEVGFGFKSVYSTEMKRNYLIKDSANGNNPLIIPCRSQYIESTTVDTILRMDDGNVYFCCHRYNNGIQGQIYLLEQNGLRKIMELENLPGIGIKNLLYCSGGTVSITVRPILDEVEEHVFFYRFDNTSGTWTHRFSLSMSEGRRIFLQDK